MQHSISHLERAAAPQMSIYMERYKLTAELDEKSRRARGEIYEAAAGAQTPD